MNPDDPDQPSLRESSWKLSFIIWSIVLVLWGASCLWRRKAPALAPLQEVEQARGLPTIESPSLPTIVAAPVKLPTQPPTPSPANPQQYTLPGAVAFWNKPVVNSLGMKFVPVRIQGGPTDGKSIHFGVWETRVRDFRAFVEDTHYDYNPGGLPVIWDKDGLKKREGFSWDKPGFEQSEDHPVACVSWEDAHAFCAWLSKKEGRQYRLPLDHEWSCAVGIGERENPYQSPMEKHSKISNVYPWKGQWPPPATAGNYAGSESKIGREPDNWNVIPGYRDAFPRASPAGSFVPNEIGLHDISGNVWEWCEDWYDSKQNERALRGGSWATRQNQLMSSYRDHHAPTFRNDNHGFRCVLVDAAATE